MGIVVVARWSLVLIAAGLVGRGAPAVEDPDPPMELGDGGGVTRAARAERQDRPWHVDVRLLLASAPGIDELETDAGEADVDRDGSGGLRVHALYGLRPGGGRWGFVVGGGPAFLGHAGTIEASDEEVGYDATGVELTGGLLFVPVRGLHLELKPHLRLGAGELDVDDLAGVDQDDVDAGGYAAFGVGAGIWYAWGGGFQLGGELGVEGWAGDSEVAGEDVTASGSSGTIAIGTGWRW